MNTMKANVFRGVNDFRIEEVARPRTGAGEAVIRVTLTTICGTDLHIVRGEYLKSEIWNLKSETHRIENKIAVVII